MLSEDCGTQNVFSHLDSSTVCKKKNKKTLTVTPLTVRKTQSYCTTNVKCIKSNSNTKAIRIFKHCF